MPTALRRAGAAMGLLALVASAIAGSDLFGLRESLFGSATPAPRAPAFSRVDGAPAINTQASVALSAVRPGFAALLQPPFQSQTMVLALLGVGARLVSFGFQLWIPSNLQKLGFSEISADRVLRDSALIGFPFTFSSRGSTVSGVARGRSLSSPGSQRRRCSVSHSPAIK